MCCNGRARRGGGRAGLSGVRGGRKKCPGDAAAKDAGAVLVGRLLVSVCVCVRVRVCVC